MVKITLPGAGRACAPEADLRCRTSHVPDWARAAPRVSAGRRQVAGSLAFFARRLQPAVRVLAEFRRAGAALAPSLGAKMLTQRVRIVGREHPRDVLVAGIIPIRIELQLAGQA